MVSIFLNHKISMLNQQLEVRLIPFQK